MSDTIKVVLGVLGGTALTLVLVAIFAGGGMMRGAGQMTDNGMMDGGMMGGVLGMLLMMLLWLAVLALVIALVAALVVWIVRQSRRR